MRMKLILE
uniref:Uncharacterized protein n=1 Tax=Arundo donax TaxID=35708 RepID=A0A0A8ZH22_ARUDO